MGLSFINIQNIDTNMQPTKTLAGVAVADQTLTVDGTAADMLATSLNSLTTHVFWTADGDTARFTLDGTNPTSTVGHLVADGESGIWKKEMAEEAKWIRVTTDVNLHISELSV